MMSSIANEAHGREILRQASVALERRVVVLWRMSANAEAVAILTSVPDPAHHETTLDLDATLLQWDVPLTPGSQWVACRLDDAGRWWVAPVRSEPAAPPPRGVERRRHERITLELAGLCLGAIARAPAPMHQRLPQAGALLELAREPGVIGQEVASPLAEALASAELCRRLIVDDPRMSEELRPLFLEELAKVAAGIDRAVAYLRGMQDRDGI